LTSFTHFLGAPDSGQERHVVFVDNGRSRIAQDERYRDVLRCIRCGACMNGCPVYRAAGGLSYGSPYMGPIGAVLSPLLWDDGRFADLPFASSLCGGCTEACPVGIPLHRMLLDLRADAVKDGKAGLRERAVWKGWALTFANATTARAASAMGRIGLRTVGPLVRSKGSEVDPRLLPDVDLRRDPLSLRPDPSVSYAGPVPLPLVELEPEDLTLLFRQRAASLGVVVAQATAARPGERRLRATAAIASTGSVLLTGAAAARRPLLAASRVVVEVDARTVVRYPRDVEPYLGTGDALILTGASRTADIEKQIVKGIHGSEELVIIVR
ncbi:MAG: 4Fe-4S dicluster domain-containing protein, partial [Dehalococcoidia bacterium]